MSEFSQVNLTEVEDQAPNLGLDPEQTTPGCKIVQQNGKALVLAMRAALAEGIGREVAHLATLRRMSISVAGMMLAGKTPAVEAAVVKDLGTNWEQALPNKVRLLAPPLGDSSPDSNDDRFEEALRQAKDEPITKPTRAMPVIAITTFFPITVSEPTLCTTVTESGRLYGPIGTVRSSGAFRRSRSSTPLCSAASRSSGSSFSCV